MASDKINRQAVNAENERFKVEVQLIATDRDGNKEAGRVTWLKGSLNELAAGNIYTKERDATAYTRDELEQITTHEGIGEVFTVLRIVKAD